MCTSIVVNKGKTIVGWNLDLLGMEHRVRTSKEGVFSGGDVVLGPWNVIQTVKNSKSVAAAMDAYLTKKREERAQP